MAIYTNEHLTDLLNDEYEKVRRLKQQLELEFNRGVSYEKERVKKEIEKLEDNKVQKWKRILK